MKLYDILGIAVNRDQLIATTVPAVVATIFVILRFISRRCSATPIPLFFAIASPPQPGRPNLNQAPAVPPYIDSPPAPLASVNRNSQIGPGNTKATKYD